MRRSISFSALASASLLLHLTACPSSEPNAQGEDVGIVDGPNITDDDGESSESGESSGMTTDPTTGDGDGDGDGQVGDPCETDADCDESKQLECNADTGKCRLNCGDAMVMLDAVPPPVMLVLDKSGSMVTNAWDHDGNPGTPDETRWKTLHRVTTFVLDNFEDGIDFGAQLFPSTAACPGANCYNADACVVSGTPEQVPMSSNGAAILASIPAAGADSTQIEGGTPAADGIRSALAALQNYPSEPAPAMILITDGAANCKSGAVCTDLTNCPLLEDYDTDLPMVVANANDNDGISTYVIGIDIIDALVGVGPGNGTPEANPYERLNEVAEAGGKARPGADKFYNATNEAELLAALQVIVGEVATCDIDLNKPPNEPPSSAQIDLVEFEIGGVKVPELEISPEECNMGLEDGWIWIGEPGNLVRFCGSFCDDLKSTGEVKGDYICPSTG